MRSRTIRHPKAFDRNNGMFLCEGRTYPEDRCGRGGADGAFKICVKRETRNPNRTNNVGCTARRACECFEEAAKETPDDEQRETLMAVYPNLASSHPSVDVFAIVVWLTCGRATAHRKVRDRTRGKLNVSEVRRRCL